jgi:phosphoribosyl-dephospho-CoA transferase
MYSRHDLVWLSGDGWRGALARAQPSEHDAIALWASRDWPAIVRRHDVGADANTVSLGIAPPPDPADGSKRRIALRAERRHLTRHAPPLALSDALAAAPDAWRPQLELLNAGAARYVLRSYGSLALQAITGARYLTATSDIDLLFCPVTAGQLEAGIALLSSHQASLPLDGEVMFPGGDAVAWREWRDARRGARVLVKRIDAVRLADPAALVAALAAS